MWRIDTVQLIADAFSDLREINQQKSTGHSGLCVFAFDAAHIK
jgi:hypothetical protein